MHVHFSTNPLCAAGSWRPAPCIPAAATLKDEYTCKSLSARYRHLTQTKDKSATGSKRKELGGDHARLGAHRFRDIRTSGAVVAERPGRAARWHSPLPAATFSGVRAGRQPRPCRAQRPVGTDMKEPADMRSAREPCRTRTCQPSPPILQTGVEKVNLPLRAYPPRRGASASPMEREAAYITYEIIYLSWWTR